MSVYKVLNDADEVINTINADAAFMAANYESYRLVDMPDTTEQDAELFRTDRMAATPDWEYLSLSQDTQLVNGDAKAVRVADSSKKLLLPSTTTGSTSSVNVCDLAGDTSSSSPIRVQASNANIFGGVVYNITTSKGSFNFISPRGTEDWMVHSAGDDAPDARDTPLRDKLSNPSTGTTDLSHREPTTGTTDLTKKGDT